MITILMLMSGVPTAFFSPTLTIAGGTTDDYSFLVNTRGICDGFIGDYDDVSASYGYSYNRYIFIGIPILPTPVRV